MLMGLKNIEHTTQALAVFKEKLDLTAFEFFSDIAMKRFLRGKNLETLLIIFIHFMCLLSLRVTLRFN